MNRDPFLRVALIASVTALAAGLYALFGWWRAVILVVIGLLGAVLLAEDYTPPPKPVEPIDRVERDRMRVMVVDGDLHATKPFDRAG